MTASRFIKAMHPKTSIPPVRDAVRRILDLGWWGQVKINGHRAQIHVSADPGAPVIVYNRQGVPHKKTLPAALEAEVRRLYAPAEGWSVVDAEWDKPEDRLYAFDMLKVNGKLLEAAPFQERYAQLPRLYISPSIETLPIIRNVDRCLEVLATAERRIEGLVFKSPTTEGFSDSAVVRCLCPYHAR